jgi:predicted enzyme related to lactoylglutathione lyase
VEYEGDEVVLRSGGRAVARLSSGALEEAPDPAIRPRWQVHFPVSDVEKRVTAALQHGGTVITHDPGVQATLRDPDGGLFTLTDADTAERDGSGGGTDLADMDAATMEPPD